MKKQTLQLLAVLLGTGLVITMVAVLHMVDKYPAEKFVNKISLDQMKAEEMDCANFECVALHAELAAEEFLASSITWESERGGASMTMADMGTSIPLEKLSEKLNDFTSASPLEKLTVLLFGRTYRLIPSVDEEQLKSAFAESGIEQGQKNANYIYSGGTVQIDLEQIGYGIDTDSLSTLIKSFWENNHTVPEAAELPLRASEPEIRDADLKALLEDAKAIAALEFELQGEWGGSWELAISEHMDWILPGGEEQTFRIHKEKFDEYITLDLSADIEEETIPATITEDADGKITFEGSARFGKNIIRDAFLANLEQALESKEDGEFKIPIESTMPELTVSDSLRERGITDLLEFGYTSFSGSHSDRIYNLNRGMDLFNGTIIEQGEEFSFTSLMGPIDCAHGWREELVIVGDETKPEYGGGLCQVSSTMFRAALYVGLPITARKNHSYAVSYYAYPNGYGLDATIYQPSPDLRFVNDTDGAILIQGYTEGNNAYFVFYGTNDGRTVQMEGPYAYNYHSIDEIQTTYTDELAPGVRKLDEYAHTGFDVDWYRTIIKRDPDTGEEILGERENFHSSYEARPEKWLEGKSEDSETGEES